MYSVENWRTNKTLETVFLEFNAPKRWTVSLYPCPETRANTSRHREGTALAVHGRFAITKM
jgi:predicted secreted protein